MFSTGVFRQSIKALEHPCGGFAAGLVAIAAVFAIQGCSPVILSQTKNAAAPTILAISPNSKVLATGNSFTFSASGGQPPYTYTVAGTGTIQSQVGLYVAPGDTTSDTITVTDSLGTQADASVTVLTQPSISPQSISLTASSGQSFAFTSSGGVGTPTYSIVSGSGTVDEAGVFTAGNQKGTTQLRVTDSIGNSADAVINQARLRTNGSVTTAVTDGTSWYLGGEFTAVNSWNAPSVLVLTETGMPFLGCDLKSGFNGSVGAVVATDNAIYVGGSFSQYQGQSANRIAKLTKSTCALDTTFSPEALNGFDNTVTALATTGTSLYVGGYFTAYKGIANSANRLAKLDLATGVIDTAFSPAGAATNGFNWSVNSLLISGTSLYVGGGFTAYKGIANSANRLAKLDLTSGAIDTTFSPVGAATNGFNSTVNTLAVSGASVYAGGYFTAYKGVANSARYLAKLSLATGAIDTAFSPVGATANGFSAGVSTLLTKGSFLYVGGVFSSYKGITSANKIAKLDLATGAIDSTFIPSGSNLNGFNSSVDALSSDGTHIYAGGYFSAYAGVSANRIAKFNANTWELDTTFSPPENNGFNATVRKIILNGDSLYVGGEFTAYRGIANSANYLAKLDAGTGAIDTIFSPVGVNANGFGDTVNTLEISGTSLYAGGEFINYKGVANSAFYIAKLDLLTGAIDTAFSPVGAAANGFNSFVYALHANGTSLYVGGWFTAYRGVADSANKIAKLNLDTGAIDTAFSPVGATANGFDEEVNAITSSGTSIYAGGRFFRYRGVIIPALLAKLDAATGVLDTSFTTGLDWNGANAVRALLVVGSSLYIGGMFQQYLGVPYSAINFAKVNINTGDIDTTFSPAGAGANGFGGAVESFVVSGSDLYIGGGFTYYRSEPAKFFVPVSLDEGELGD